MQQTVLPAPTDTLFSVQAGPDAAFSHPSWQQARAAALQALEAGGITLLTGPPGCGKSLLLKELARTLRREGKPARLVEHASALGTPPAGTALLVDEADALSPDALAALCDSPAPTLLAALPGFEARLARLARPFGRVVLGVLPAHDVARYVAARLDAAGRPPDLLDPGAVQALARHSGGLLRLVNTLGGAAVFLAGLDGSAQVGAAHVEEAASMRDGFAADPLPDVAGPAPAAPALVAPVPVLQAPAPPGPVFPDYRREVMRRRAALGTMVAASGVLFAMPWLTRVRRGATKPVLAAGSGPAHPDAPVQAATKSMAATDTGSPVPQAPASPASQPALSAEPAPSAADPALRSDVSRLAETADPAMDPAPTPSAAPRAQAAVQPPERASAAPAPEPASRPSASRSAEAADPNPGPSAPPRAQAGVQPPERAVAAPAPEPALRPNASRYAEAAGPSPRPSAAPRSQAGAQRPGADTPPSGAAARDSRVALAAQGPVLFQGPIYNETMGQGGYVTLVIRQHAPDGAITAQFNASQGLSGTGVLAGSLSGTGRITASGPLHMGQNVFYCDLSGAIAGPRLTGSASFARSGNSSYVARSTFNLTRMA